MEEREVHLTKNVFVAGASPKITYNPRDARHLEGEMTGYLDQGPGRALSVSGPTKSGKTVLVERALPRDEAIWVEGQDVGSVDVFWDRIVDWLGLYDLVEVTRGRTDESGNQLGGTLGIPKLASIEAKMNEGEAVTVGVRKSRTQAVTTVARTALEEVAVPLVIDDFHYIEEGAKQPMARAVKSVIPFTKVVLIAVPHEAVDVVRNESDMGYRVSQLEIETWSVEELTFIAERGFNALNIVDYDGIGLKLAEASYGAPFLMQDLCYHYTVSLGVLQTAGISVAAVEPPSWDEFFARIANRAPPAIFGHLLRGPRSRGQRRVPRVFKAGVRTDVYGVLLYAIARVGNASVSYQDLAKVIERDFTEAIGGQQITASLGHMAAVAFDNRGTGEPAVAYKDDVLHILDPFLLFYLRHGTWDVAKDIEGSVEQGELSGASVESA